MGTSSLRGIGLQVARAFAFLGGKVVIAEMSEQQFLTIPLRAAYDGLMPPEHAGAATVYLVAKLAAEFHGQSVNGYEVLEKAGLLKTIHVELCKDEASSAPVVRADAIALIKQVEAMLAETETEFNKLPVFIRPMAKSGL